jgi:hypothetical protein
MKDARWDLYLPPDYDYGRFRGSMTYEPEAVERPSAYAFSFEDYAQVEGKRLLARKAQITRGIRKAQQELAQQKLKDASVVYEQVQMGEVDRDADSLQAVDDIRNRLRQAQARNVITAQREFAAAASRAEGMAQPAAQVAAPEAQEAPGKGEWDESAALQWDRVQQAQELGVARVRPLHVYLPTRGLHYGFSQALQTEPGRPLTVRLRAVSTRGIGLLQGVAMAAVGLIVLWVAAGMALRRARG